MPQYTSDSAQDIERSTRLNIDDVGDGSSQPQLKPTVYIKLSDIGRLDTPVTEDMDDTSGDEISAGFYNVDALVDDIHRNGVVSDTLPDEEFNSALEAYENENVRFYNDINVVEDSINDADKLESLVGTVDEINDTNLPILKIAVETLYDKLGLVKYPFVISTEEFYNTTKVKYTETVLESLQDTIKNTYRRRVEYLKKMWDSFVDVLKKVFSSI